MNKRLAAVLAFAFVIAGAASYLLYLFLGQRLAQAGPQNTKQIVVAARNLEIGTLISEQDVKLAEWTSDVPPSSFSKAEDVVGRGVIAPVYAGEPILDGRLAPKGAGAGLAATIPVGMRAVAVRVNDIVGVAGFIPPGSRVDLLIMGNPPNANNSRLGTLSKTLLQDIEVISAGQQIQRDNEGKPVQVPVVNLLVTPEQAEIISLASSQASIQFILRNPLDKEETKTRGTALALLYTDQKTLPPPPPPRPPRTASSPEPHYVPVPPSAAAKPDTIVVEVITGANKQQLKFNEEEKQAQ